MDFEAAWDGPIANAVEVITSGVTPVQVDDLIVCENCLREAFNLLDFDDKRSMVAQIILDKAKLEDENSMLKAHVEQLEQALITAPPRAKAQTPAPISEGKGRRRQPVA